ncbi:MAG: hypothetical protein IKZ58_01055 [Selenomonadaceae bacterium]|nr:hypothetical protein [Selenomonadaceae bacterium]
MRYQKANEEFHKLIKWALDEEEKITNELVASGKYVIGLDTNRAAYEPINSELKRRVLELFDKYDLPNKPKR